MSEEEEILSNADASYGGTTDAESVISAGESLVGRVIDPEDLDQESLNPDQESLIPEADAPEALDDDDVDEDDVPAAQLEDAIDDDVSEPPEPLDEDVLAEYAAKNLELSEDSIQLQFLQSSEKEKPKSEDLLKIIPGECNTKTTKELIVEVADNVHSCRVCYDLYHQDRNQARILCCGHSFCTRCVVRCSQPSNMNRENPFGVKCPECRYVSQQAPAAMPVNFQFMQLLTVLSLVKDPAAQPDPDEKYQNFERLGKIVPDEEMSKLSMEELHEHSKVLFRAMRQRATREKEQFSKYVSSPYEIEFRRLDTIERDVERVVKNVTRYRLAGEDAFLRPPAAQILSSNFRRYMQRMDQDQQANLGGDNNLTGEEIINNNDWMREMVVYGERNPAITLYRPFAPMPDTEDEYFRRAQERLVQRAEARREAARTMEIEDVLEQEALAREGADPRRNLDVVREAHFRRERESAQQRETNLINEQIVRRLMVAVEETTPPAVVHDPPRRRHDWEVFDLPRREEEEDNDSDDESSTTTSEDEDDSDAEEDVGQPAPAVDMTEDPIFRMTPPVTIGEAVTVFRIVDSVRSRHRLLVPPSLPQRYVQQMMGVLMASDNPTEEANREQVDCVREFAEAHETNAAQLVQICREFAIRYSSNIFEAPRLLNRRRRRRAQPADEYNALLTVIRKRAKQALKGNSPTQPVNDEESNLTLRLIVNIANQMGVRDQLEHCLCPHRTPTPPQQHEDEEVFVPNQGTSTRSPTLFCNVCRCSLPLASQQDHAQGRKHLANVNRRQNATTTTTATSTH